MPSDELKAAELQTLAGHYSESCKFMKETQRRRDYYFLCLLLILIIFTAQYQDENIASSIVKYLLSSDKGSLATVASKFTKSLLWLLLMGCTIRYYQTQIFLKKKYKYIHKIEEVIQGYYPDNISFSREGTSYLSWSPSISKLIRTLYQLVFPLVLLMMVCNRALYCDVKWESFSLIDGVVLGCFVVIVSSTCCYCVDMAPKKNVRGIRLFKKWVLQCVPIIIVILSISNLDIFHS